jgi:hypothetical protein
MPLFTDSPLPTAWRQALNHMQSALILLDESDAPEDVAAHLDLALCRLEVAMGRSSDENSVPGLHKQIEDAFASVMEDAPLEPAATAW